MQGVWKTPVSTVQQAAQARGQHATPAAAVFTPLEDGRGKLKEG